MHSDSLACTFRPVMFEPTFHKHARLACGGCQVHVIDRATFRPVLSAVALIDAFRRADPKQFAWRDPPYEYEFVRQPIDLLFGSPRLRDALATDTTPVEIAEGWAGEINNFMKIRERFLLYT